MKRKRQIITIGGGGFATEDGNLTIDRHVLKASGKDRPADAFIPTASGDSEALLVRFYAAFSGLSAAPSHLPFFRRTPDLRKYLLAQDVIYVGPGNTKSMLAIWSDWGLPDILREAWNAGIVLAGTSAGAICWYEQGITDSFDGELRALDCLGFLPGSCCPHYDGEAQRRPTYHKLLAREQVKPGVAIDDCAAIHFIDTTVHKVLASKPGSAAYAAAVSRGAVRERPLAPAGRRPRH